MAKSRERKRRRPLVTAPAAILVLLAAAGLIVGIVFLFKSCSLVSNKRSLPFAASANAAYTGDGFLYFNGTSLEFTSLKDENKNYSLPINNANARAAGTPGIKVVYNSRAFQIVGMPYDIEVSGEIVKLCCGGRYAALYSRYNEERTLRVYDSTGSQCFQLDFTESVLTDFGFDGSDGNGSILWTSELITAGNSVTTTVTLYDLDRNSTTGVISIQGQLVKHIYITNDSIFAMCTDELIRYDRRSNAEMYRLLTYGYECISCSFKSGRALFVLRSGDEGASSVRLLRVNEKDVASERSALLTLPEDALACFAMNGRFIIVSAGQIAFYDDTGVFSKAVELDHSITAAERLDERNLLLSRGEEALLYGIR